jgi:hypothetical protein
MNVMLDEGGILTVVQREPETCEEVWASAAQRSAWISVASTQLRSRTCSPTPGRARPRGVS